MFGINDEDRLYSLVGMDYGAFVFMLPCSQLQPDQARIAAIQGIIPADGGRRITINDRRFENSHWHSTDKGGQGNIMFRCHSNNTWLNHLWRPRREERPDRETPSNCEINVYNGIDGINLGANIGLGYVAICRTTRPINAGDVLIGRQTDDGHGAPDGINMRPGIANTRRPTVRD